MPSNLPVVPPVTPIAQLADSTSSSTDQRPKRKIYTAVDLDAWFSSRAHADLEAYALELCHAVEGRKVEDECFESEIVHKTTAFLKEAEAWIDDIPLQTTPQRFGNKAFRDWLAKVQERNEDFQKSLLPASSASSPVLQELSFHFVTSFGSGPRLDYGTGHELSFLLWLVSLRLLGILSPKDNQAVVLRIFTAYLDLVRKLQKVFKLEPAGSKGVWGLDDHQHLSYLFGASQLIDQPTLRPSHILQPRILVPLAQSYLFPSSILHIHALKSGPFSEHSPLLHQIASTVPNWTKVQNGLWKMYREEVLSKVPVVQHLRFGLLIRWTNRETGEELPSTGDGKEEGEDEENGDRNANEHEQAGFVKAPWLHQGSAPTSNTTTSLRNPGLMTLSSAAAKRTPYTVSSPGSTTKPTIFSPPTLFPSRTSGTSQRIPATFSASNTGRRTLADAGGAAAQSSPFGVLESATDATRCAGRGKTDGGPVDTGPVDTGPVITKAPWAN